MSAVRARTLIPVVAICIVAAGCSGQKKQTAPSPDQAQTQASRKAATVTPSANTNEESVEKMLQGRIAGVTVSPTAEGGIAVRIRGASSVYGNTAPLYVLDGMAIEPGPNGSLSGINPRDIESIRVLKEPAETAMYGSRGANGVILIKTKRPPAIKQ